MLDSPWTMLFCGLVVIAAALSRPIRKWNRQAIADRERQEFGERARQAWWDEKLARPAAAEDPKLTAAMKASREKFRVIGAGGAQ